MTKKISKYISYKEATHSRYAKENGIVNKPKAEHIENMQVLAEKVFEPLREWVGNPIRVNSMFRSEKLNTALRGSHTSSHLQGKAMDITSIDGKTNLEMFHYIKDNLDFDQLIWEFGAANPKWIHVSYNSEKENRKQILVIRKKGVYKVYNDCKTC